MIKKEFLISKSFVDRKIIIGMIFIIISILIVIQNNAFMFNPFILILLSVSCAVSFSTFFAVSISMSLIGFIIKGSYGLELLITSIIFLIFYFLSLFIKSKRIRLFLPSLASILVIFIVYYFSSEDAFYAKNALVLLFFSAGYSFSIISLIDKYNNKEEIDKTVLVTIIGLLNILFIPISSFTFVWISFLLLLLLKSNKKELYYMSLFSSFSLMYFFGNVPINMLTIIYSSFFFLILIRSRLSYYFFVPLLSFFMMTINDSFYLDQTFYQLIIGFVLVLCVPETIIEKISKIIDYNPVDSLKDVVQYQQNKIDQVSKLCTLLMDDRFDKVEGLDLQLEKIIKKEICSRCSKENCNIALSKYLSGYLSSNEKGEIVNNCLYPFQIQKAINSSNKRIIEYRDREEKSVESKKIMNNTYQIIKKFIDIKPKNKITSNIYKVEYEKITTQAESSPNGDYCKMFVNDGNEMVILSDGMGHTNKSKDISEYLVELVNYLSVIYNNVNEAIEASNKILIAKTYEEVYATLDIADFDLEIGKVSIYKAGSFPTYIIRNKKIREIRTKLPPVGIINSINVEPEIIDIQHNDILLFLTDGYGDNIAEIIEKTIQKASFLPLKSYLKFLNKKLNENLHINDDQTIVGIKVIKI